MAKRQGGAVAGQHILGVGVGVQHVLAAPPVHVILVQYVKRDPKADFYCRIYFDYRTTLNRSVCPTPNVLLNIKNSFIKHFPAMRLSSNTMAEFSFMLTLGLATFEYLLTQAFFFMCVHAVLQGIQVWELRTRSTWTPRFSSCTCAQGSVILLPETSL